jgi:hypothetical protein
MRSTRRPRESDVPRDIFLQLAKSAQGSTGQHPGESFRAADQVEAADGCKMDQPNVWLHDRAPEPRRLFQQAGGFPGQAFR